MRFKKIYIEITNICNKNCSFCSPSIRKKKEMSIENFEYILKEIKEYTEYIYLHVKGEPLLHSNFSNIIELCEKYNFKVNITTNGTLLKQKEDILKNSSIRQINISLHSFEKEKNDSYFEDIFNVSNSLLKENTNLNIVYRFWALKNNRLSTNNQYIVNLIKDKYKVTDEQINSMIKYNNLKIKDRLYINKDSVFEWPNIKNEENITKSSCYGTRSHIAILSDGTVIPCCLDSEGIINLGNIFNKSLSAILTSDKFIKINEEIKNKKFEEKLCKHCSYRNRFNIKKQN